VIKADGTEEAFCPGKLTGAMLHGMRDVGADRACEARQFALAIGIYLKRAGWKRISTAAVFEMTLRVLHSSALSAVARSLEDHRTRRGQARQQLRIRHEGGKVTLWDKGWLAELAQRSWFLTPTTGRILAGEIERDLLGFGASVVSRRDILDRLNARVAEYGLADAVPVHLPAAD